MWVYRKCTRYSNTCLPKIWVKSWIAKEVTSPMEIWMKFFLWTRINEEEDGWWTPSEEIRTKTIICPDLSDMTFRGPETSRLCGIWAYVDLAYSSTLLSSFLLLHLYSRSHILSPGTLIGTCKFLISPHSSFCFLITSGYHDTLSCLTLPQGFFPFVFPATVSTIGFNRISWLILWAIPSTEARSWLMFFAWGHAQVFNYPRIGLCLGQMHVESNQLHLVAKRVKDSFMK